MISFIVRALARGQYGELHVGYAASPTVEILPPALAAFQKAFPHVNVLSGKRLAYRPLAGIKELVPVGIARAKSGDVTPAGEKFCEILRKVAKGQGGGGSKAATT